ncbi:hypothetical protein KQI68_06565 [Peptoniphilus sp. MSJ-1]|uniref:Uncharacterized protein n=1 Tax=Peptoniphilus ovalis TaxID=2841503 RepID=A0ABS6FH48_9FIRM|nr:hypothetical protein [Peptoniphilus ovalis]MBU5669500.1 hypothetical protein [Peptoniphilus ovalis]
MNFLNSIYYKTLVALYKLNTDKDGRSKSVLIDAIYEALRIGDEGLQNGKLAMALDTATGEWLDYWGYVLGVSRDFGENDDDYRFRIIEEIIAPKNTIEAIKRATARKINKGHKEEFIPESIRVFEPWTELIILDERGVLDGTSRIISYDYWIYSVIDISLPDSSYITPDLIKYLNKIKAGGVKIVFSLAPRWDIITDIDRLERNTHVWEKIHRNTYIDVKEVDNTIFHTVPIGATNEEDIQNTILDGFSLLEGKQIIYWDGVELSRSYYGTGTIRNYAGGYLSLEDLAVIMQKENPTIADALEYERQAIEGTREKEGKFNISLKPIEIKTERI